MVARLREGLGSPSLRNICLAGGTLAGCLRDRACTLLDSARGSKQPSFCGCARESDTYAAPIGSEVKNDSPLNGVFWPCLLPLGCQQARSCASIHSVRTVFGLFLELTYCCPVDRCPPDELKRASRPAKIR